MVLFLHVTSRVESDPHQEMLREKGGSGFPYLVYLDAHGDVIAKQGARSVDAFRATLEGDVAAWNKLVDLAATGDPDAGAALLVKKIELGHFSDVEAARAEMSKRDRLTDAQRAELEQTLVDQEFNQILGTVRSIEGAAAAGARTVPMLEKGRIPKSGSLPMYFWLFLGKHGEDAKDAALLGRAIDALDGMPRIPKQMLDDLRKALESMKKG